MAPREPQAGEVVQGAHVEHPVPGDVVDQDQRDLALGGDPQQALERRVRRVGRLTVPLVFDQSGQFATVVFQKEVGVHGGDVDAPVAVSGAQGGAAVSEKFGGGHGSGFLWKSSGPHERPTVRAGLGTR